MKAIILSAGQGSRLLPLTENSPKCLLPLEQGHTLLSWQLSRLEMAGFEEAVVVTGFHFEKVEKVLADYKGQIKIKSVYNPFYKAADNLASLWMVREEMKDGPFVVLNGDTLFTEEVARTLMGSPDAPITLTTSCKGKYDSDDMKVIREGTRLKAVGKKLDLEKVNAESIGFMMFRGEGQTAFIKGLEDAMSTQEGLKRWYLSVISDLAEDTKVETIDVAQDQWAEVDFPVDYEDARKAVRKWLSQGDSSAIEAVA